jgi:SUMO ligase MMS21 Smc5/6 complex component
MDFVISIDDDELDEVLVKKNRIVIKCKFNCYCYDNNPRNTEYFILSSKNNVITVRDAINCLVNNSFKCDCNHVFLEGFDMITPIEFEAFFGS